MPGIVQLVTESKDLNLLGLSNSKFCVCNHGVILHLFPYTDSNSSNSYYLSGIYYMPGVYIYYLRVSQPPWKVIAAVF